MAGLVQNFAGVLGWPLTRTLSPAIHMAAFRRLGFDWAYLSFPVPPDLLPQAVGGLRALGAVGANVTIPHKETVIAHLDQLSGDAAAIGAVNTIQRLGDRLIGHNTDVDGFREFIAGDAGINVSGSRALVLGAGGAARAVVKALDDLDAAEIVIADPRSELRVAITISDASRSSKALTTARAAPPVPSTRARLLDTLIPASPAMNSRNPSTSVL